MLFELVLLICWAIYRKNKLERALRKIDEERKAREEERKKNQEKKQEQIGD